MLQVMHAPLYQTTRKCSFEIFALYRAIGKVTKHLLHLKWLNYIRRFYLYICTWSFLSDIDRINKQSYTIHLAVCLTTGPKPLPKRALHIERSRASSFKWEYPLLSLRSSNNFVRLLPSLPVTSIPPCIFPSITRCRRQFLRKMWPIQFAFRLRISGRTFLCSLHTYI
jgi:hypothetical protein